MTAVQAQSTPGMDYLNLLKDIDADNIEWDAQIPGARAKFLKFEDDLYVAIEQWDPGFTIPFLDEHGGPEFIYVLKGTIIDENGTCGAGTLVCSEPGTSHRPGSADGSTTVVFRRLAPGERDGIWGYYHPEG
jgi:anti-sigma factor ChrR (cupin superfamily)